MLGDHASGDRVLSLEPVVTAAEVLAAQDAAARVQASQPLREYLVRVLAHTRADDRIEVGASPRAGLMLLRAAKARAMLYGREPRRCPTTSSRSRSRCWPTASCSHPMRSASAPTESSPTRSRRCPRSRQMRPLAAAADGNPGRERPLAPEPER